MPYTIKNLQEALDSINQARASSPKGGKLILKKDWSTFLTGYGSAPVRQVWIASMLKGEGVQDKDRAIRLLAALNGCLKRHKLPLMDDQQIDVI